MEAIDAIGNPILDEHALSVVIDELRRRAVRAVNAGVDALGYADLVAEHGDDRQT